MPEDVRISGQMIALGQLLKLAGVAGSGGEIKLLLASEPALVNGQEEARRGRKLHPGDVVSVGDRELRVTSTDPA